LQKNTCPVSIFTWISYFSIKYLFPYIDEMFQGVDRTILR